MRCASILASAAPRSSIASGIGGPRQDRLIRQAGTAETEIEAERHRRNDDEDDDDGRARAHRRAPVTGRLAGLGRLARRDQPARRLRARARRFARRQLAAFDVAIDFGKLRLMESDGARLALRARSPTRQRPKRA